MTPTNKLRFVKRWRTVMLPEFGEGIGQAHGEQVLQQWWEEQINYTVFGGGVINLEGEWRDVPVEEEK